jgi:hypothetical protein
MGYQFYKLKGFQRLGVQNLSPYFCLLVYALLFSPCYTFCQWLVLNISAIFLVALSGTVCVNLLTETGINLPLLSLLVNFIFSACFFRRSLSISFCFFVYKPGI